MARSTGMMIRRHTLAIACLSLVLVGCGHGTTGPMRGTGELTGQAITATAADAADAVATIEALWTQVPITASAWSDPQNYPPSQPSAPFFWFADAPQNLPARAFPSLPSDSGFSTEVRVRAYTLTATLPRVPQTLPVYVVGCYPAGYRDTLQRIVAKPSEAWDFDPRLSLVASRSVVHPATPTTIASDGVAQRYAAQVLRERGLLMPDTVVAAPQRNPDGTWRVRFFQRIGGVPVYANKALAATIDSAGQVTDVLGRRRPLLAQSAYPARSPADAWMLLLQGKGRTYYVDDGTTSVDVGTPLITDAFAVTDVKLAYLETEVVTPRQVLAPYYAFRGDRRTIYVPAIAAPYVAI